MICFVYGEKIRMDCFGVLEPYPWLVACVLSYTGVRKADFVNMDVNALLLVWLKYKNSVCTTEERIWFIHGLHDDLEKGTQREYVAEDAQRLIYLSPYCEFEHQIDIFMYACKFRLITAQMDLLYERTDIAPEKLVLLIPDSCYENSLDITQWLLAQSKVDELHPLWFEATRAGMNARGEQTNETLDFLRQRFGSFLEPEAPSSSPFFEAHPKRPSGWVYYDDFRPARRPPIWERERWDDESEDDLSFCAVSNSAKSSNKFREMSFRTSLPGPSPDKSTARERRKGEAPPEPPKPQTEVEVQLHPNCCWNGYEYDDENCCRVASRNFST